MMKMTNSCAVKAPVVILGGLLAAFSLTHAWFGWSDCFKELCWSPDCRNLCFTEYSAFSGGDVDGQNPTGDDALVRIAVDSPIVKRYLLPTGGLAPSLLGDKAVVGSSQVLDLRSGRLGQLPVSGIILRWSPDERRLACIQMTGMVDVGPEYASYELWVADMESRESFRAIPRDTLLLEDVLGCHWVDKQTIVCSTRVRAGEQDSWSTRYVSVDAATGATRPITGEEYRSTLPAPRPVVRDTVLESALMIDFPDGTSRTIKLPVTKGPVRVRRGEVSPDGREVVFEWKWDNGEDSPWQWTVINLDGTGWGNRSDCLYPPVWVSGGARLFYLEQGEVTPPTCVVEGVMGMTICTNDGSVTPPQLSPDRSHTLFEVHENNEISLAIIDVDTPGFRFIRDAHSAQWLGDGSRILYRSQDDYVVAAASGTELSRIPLAFNGYSPQWVSDSLILFRAGYGRCGDLSAAVPYVVYETLPGGRVVYSTRIEEADAYVPETLRYCSTDPVWQVNPLTGRMGPAPASVPTSGYAQYKPAPAGTRIPSPDGRHVAWIETRAARNGPMYLKSRIWVADADGTGSRMLLESPGNFALGDDEDDK